MPRNQNRQLAKLLFCLLLPVASAFSPHSLVRPTSTQLYLADVTVRTPSQEESVVLGIREWPQQAKSKGTFQENCKDTLVRYVLDGKGSVRVSDGEDSKQITMVPGSLLEVQGEAILEWEIKSNEMIILTPGFEQVGLFAGVALALVVLLGALVASS